MSRPWRVHVVGHLANGAPRSAQSRPCLNGNSQASQAGCGQKKTPAIPEKGRGLRQISYSRKAQLQGTRFDALCRALSVSRLAGYRTANDTDVDVLARYQWNLALSGALYPLLQHLEVALRNALHDALSYSYGQRWYEGELVLRTPAQHDQLADAKAELLTSNKPDQPNHVVAALQFGFWTSLLNDIHGRRSDPHALWPRHLDRVFPHLNRPHEKFPRGRDVVSSRFNRLRDLRNRIFHHEPIWRGRTVDAAGGRMLLRLDDEHRDLLEALGWITPTLRAAAEQLDTFPQIFDSGYGLYLSWAGELLVPLTDPPATTAQTGEPESAASDVTQAEPPEST